MASKRDLTVRRRRARKEADPPVREQKAAPATKKKRRRQGRSALWPVLFRLLLVVVLVMLGVLIWRNRTRLAPAAVVEWFDRVVTGGEGGDGFPVAISGSRVTAMQSLGSQTAVLTDTSLILYNSAGAVIADRHHTFARPVLHTAGDYMLITESEGGSRYTLSTRRETVYSGQTANPLRSASVDADGRIALVTGSTQSYMSEVLVVDREGKELFHWYGADVTAVDAAVTPGGKRVAVLGLSAQNGEMRSTLQVFPLAGKEAKAEYTYYGTGTMMVALHCYNNGRIGVVGDTAAWMCDPGGETDVYSYENEVLLGYAFSDKGLGLVTRGLGESSGGSFVGLTAAGKQTVPVAFSGEFRHAAAAENGWYLLTDSALYNPDAEGLARRADAAADSLMVSELNGKPLVLSLTAITRCEWQNP